MAALPTAPQEVTPHLVPDARCRRIKDQFGFTPTEQLTSGFRIHVAIASHWEAVTALDRIRSWFPTLPALSANSPFWHGTHTGDASYRYQAWPRWPAASPTERFYPPAGYAPHRAALPATGVPVDAGML